MMEKMDEEDACYTLDPRFFFFSYSNKNCKDINTRRDTNEDTRIGKTVALTVILFIINLFESRPVWKKLSRNNGEVSFRVHRSVSVIPIG